MTKQSHSHRDAADLRRRAEERLRARKAKERPATDRTDPQRLLHELEVHQVELEIQNEELRAARQAAEAALERGDAGDRVPLLVIDGEEVSWETFGRTLMQVEGFQLKLQICDKSEEC